MSLVLADRVRETTLTTGTGTITLDGAVQGFQSFSVIGNNNTTYYTINRGSEWEVGIGTYYGGTLLRDTVYASSNGGSKVNFSAGSKDVFVTYPASKSVNEDANNRVLIPYTSGTTNVGSLNVGNATSHTDSGVIAGFTASEPLYLYTSLQNTSSANTSYASYAVNDGGHTAYGELGINNSNYSYSAAGFPNNGFSTPLATFVESYGGPLVLGSWDSQKISFIVNGAVNTSDAMTVETTGAVTIPSVAVTGGVINNATIGATTPSTGTFTTLIGGGGSANYGQLTGGATTKAVEFQTLGSDSNIALVLDSKGTGAIDLAAGSSGVNISNGGTVTAITRTAGGTGYTVAPTVTISAPTTAGGVQATATCTVTAGVVDTAFTITNAGSGYVEQPTITFTPVSGGSGATAYATVGSGTIIRSLGSTSTQSLDFYTPASLINSIPVFRIRDNAGTGYFMMYNQSGSAALVAQGGTNDNALISGNGSGSVRFTTNGTTQTEQMRVSHTASAVNYVQVTGSPTGYTASTAASILFTGSDSAVSGTIIVKGTSSASTISFAGSGLANYHAFRVQTNGAVNTGNLLQVQGATSGSAPTLSAISGPSGTDADIDIALSPKGAGAVRFGTYTASVLTPTGYITIKDSGGTTRRLLVG